jgi:hypothetical protein
MENYYLGETRPTISKPVVAVAGLLALGLVGYALKEHRVAQSAAAENAQVLDSLNTTRSEIDGLTATVKALAARPDLQPAPARAPAPATTVVHRTESPRHRNAVDPRFEKLESQLDAQGKAIDAQGNAIDAQGKAIEDTRNDLTSTRTELTSSIARTHDELVVLEKKGERNYYEFDIDKSKQFQPDGPLGIRLKKANDKHQYADLELMVDDRNLSQKHVNLYQPVMFYTPDSLQPLQLVINSVSKNHIHGYVSAPKYDQSELATMTNANTQAGATGATQAPANATAPPPPRQKLPMPN